MALIPKVGKRHWDFWYNFLATNCMHGVNCKKREKTQECSAGSRIYKLHAVSGE
jgi:hypothetical protein